MVQLPKGTCSRPHSFDDEYLNSASSYYSQLERDLWMLDVTSDFEIPTFVALSRRRNSNTEDLIYGAGTHAEPKIAALRAVCELNQCLSWVSDSEGSKSRPKIDDPVALQWWRTTRLEDCLWLAPSDLIRTADDYSHPDTEDMRDDIEYCRAKVERQRTRVFGTKSNTSRYRYAGRSSDRTWYVLNTWRRSCLRSTDKPGPEPTVRPVRFWPDHFLLGARPLLVNAWDWHLQRNRSD